MYEEGAVYYYFQLQKQLLGRSIECEFYTCIIFFRVLTIWNYLFMRRKGPCINIFTLQNHLN